MAVFYSTIYFRRWREKALLETILNYVFIFDDSFNQNVKLTKGVYRVKGFFFSNPVHNCRLQSFKRVW